MLVISTIFYIVSIIIVILLLKRKTIKKDYSLYIIMPSLFVLIEALYVLPLSIRSIFTLEIEGDISPQINEFVDYIPASLMMCIIFNSLFLYFYIKIRKNNKEIKSLKKNNNPSKLGYLFLLASSFLMLSALGSEVGGISNLILTGYNVTEHLSNSSQYAVVFDWLAAISITLIFHGYRSRSTPIKYTGIILFIALTLALLIMGRRAAIVVLLGSFFLGYHIFIKKISLKFIIPIVISGFVFLNFIGLIRGESYDDINSLYEKIEQKNNDLKEDQANPGLFYTLSTGNFAVPFETFPQIIRGFDEKYSIGFGTYSARAVTFLIPSFLWEDRPIPLSNWYMVEFYGVSEKNIGRQFFFLTSAFMDFNIFGILLMSFIIPNILNKIVTISYQNTNDPVIIAFTSIFTASLLNFMASDALGFVIVFFKSFGIPLLILHLSRKIRFN